MKAVTINEESITRCSQMIVGDKKTPTVLRYMNNIYGSRGSVSKMPEEIVEDGVITAEELTTLQGLLQKIANGYNIGVKHWDEVAREKEEAEKREAQRNRIQDIIDFKNENEIPLNPDEIAFVESSE